MNAAENVMQPDLGAHLGDRLHLLIEHDLPPAQEALARAHLDSCDACATEHARLEHTVQTLRAMGRRQAPMGFAARLLRRVRAGQRRSFLSGGLATRVPYEGTIIVLIAAAVAAAVLAWQATERATAPESPEVTTPR